MFIYQFRDGEVYSCSDKRNFKRYRGEKAIHKYGDLITAYEAETGLKAPECPYCGESCEPIRFLEFKTYCGHPDCYLQIRRASGKKTAKINTQRYKDNVAAALQNAGTKECFICGKQFAPRVLTTGRDSSQAVVEKDRLYCYSKSCCSKVRQTDIMNNMERWKYSKVIIRDLISGNLDTSDIDQLYLDVSFDDKELDKFRKLMLRGCTLYTNLEHMRVSFITHYDYGDGYLYSNGTTPHISRCLNCGNGLGKTSNQFEYIVVPTNYLKGTKFCKHSCYIEAKNKGIFVQPYSEETRKKLSNHMSRMIADGILTPNITDTWTKQNYEFLGVKYRSSWEVLFAAIQHVLGELHKIEYETLRVKYKDPTKNKVRTYIPDFIDHSNRIVYEIKPESLKDTDRNLAKDESLLEWCQKNGYSRVFVTEKYFTRVLTDTKLKLDVEELVNQVKENFFKRYMRFL